MGKGTRELKKHQGPAREDREMPRPVNTKVIDLAAAEQLSREVLILEMLRSELLERNSRLERWHAQHPHTSTSQSGSSKAPRDTFNRANAGASGGSGKASTSHPVPTTEVAPPHLSSHGRDCSSDERHGCILLPH